MVGLSEQSRYRSISPAVHTLEQVTWGWVFGTIALHFHIPSCPHPRTRDFRLGFRNNRVTVPFPQLPMPSTPYPIFSHPKVIYQYLWTARTERTILPKYQQTRPNQYKMPHPSLPIPPQPTPFYPILPHLIQSPSTADLTTPHVTPSVFWWGRGREGRC